MVIIRSRTHIEVNKYEFIKSTLEGQKEHSGSLMCNISVIIQLCLSGHPFFPFTFLRMLLALVLTRKKAVAEISLANKSRE
jgi:hypothetical protein